VAGRSRPSAVPPLRFSPLQRLPARGSGNLVGLSTPDRLASSGFLNLLTPLSAPGLPALFHAGSARGVRPSELCSFRTGGDRLRYHYPLAVSDGDDRLLARTTFTSSGFLGPRTWTGGLAERRYAPSPAASGSCSVRESATRAGGLDRLGRVALLGFAPFRVLCLAGRDGPSSRPPLVRL